MNNPSVDASQPTKLFPIGEGRGEVLHVVCFNVPWPADYGGVIDVFYRVKSLAADGWRIHLHCYTYGRQPAEELERFCEKVYYYPRATGWKSQLAKRPYIVASRQSKELVDRLRADSCPILLEGLHDCYVLEQLQGAKRHIYVRAHNVEHDYYKALCKAEKSWWKKLFFQIEAAKLRAYEPVLRKATSVWAISETDAEHFRALGCKQVCLVPPSHGHLQVSSKPGRGNYVLYHGNLSVPENIRAVRFLAEHLLSDGRYSFIIAGREPDAEVQRITSNYQNVTLVANPSNDEMDTLIADAQVNLLVTDQPTGVKLKLMNALYQGRHCLVNDTMVAGTQLAPACTVASTPQDLKEALALLWEKEFTQEDCDMRKKLLAVAR